MEKREIKFRFWIEKAKQMCEWETAKVECDRLSLFTMDGFIPMQYTGLKDKNGVEIFEGDILRFSKGGDFMCKAIDFKDGAFMLTSDEGHRYYPYGSEVIGNVYQHPELCSA